MKLALLLFLCIFGFQPRHIHAAQALEKEPISLFIVIPSYNNELWCINNLTSIAEQKYPHWQAYYINDNSTDNTLTLVQRFIKKNKLQNKIKVINNSKRVGALANTYNAIQKANPKSVVIMVDGDDRLKDENVFEYVASTYKNNPNVWLTYGNYIAEPTFRRSVCGLFPEEIVKNNNFRNYKYITGHLRTFYAGLFQLIKKQDLLDQNGEFLKSAGDVATMMPMMEMASLGHYRFIPKILYIYNVGNPICDHNNRPVQRDCSLYVRAKKPYAPLKSAPWLK
jgi:glycosyltransferase involved in cell wall biosynthesis